jgi:signal transduction histidine kinase
MSIVMFSLFAFVISTIVEDNFIMLEEQSVLTNINRVSNAYHDQIEYINAIASEWSSWEDTVDFINGENPEYIASNLNTKTFVNLQINFIIFYNTSGFLQHSQAVDIINQNPIALSDRFIQDVSSRTMLLNHSLPTDSLSGLVIIDQNPNLLSSHPIIPYNSSGPIEGTIIIGRFIDDTTFTSLSMLTNTTLNWEQYNSINLPSSFLSARQHFQTNSSPYIKPLNDTNVSGFFLLNDLSGNPAIILELQMPREMYAQGQKTLSYVMLGLTFIGIVFVILQYFMIKAFIINRLENMDHQISAIGSTHDFSLRVEEQGTDEIGHLAKVFNLTMSKLEHLNNTLEEQVQHRTERINQLLKHKDEFVNQLGHDLKNPLGPMINLLPILEEKETDPKKKEILTVLRRNAGYMKNLVIKTIELAKLNSPAATFHFEQFNLSHELDEIIKTNLILLEQKKIDLNHTIPSDLTVYADKLKFQQLITNILTNAVKYTNPSGTITIDAEKDNDMVTISVQDTGIGMTGQQLEHIFDEFYKADVSRHDFDSSGLGMPIAKRIVEKHGGHIWAASDGLNKGSCISFCLPQRKSAPIGSITHAKVTEISTEIDRILIERYP